MGKDNGCQGKLVETVLGEGGEKIPTKANMMFIYLLLLARNCYLWLTIYHPVFCVLFNTAKSMESKQK